MKNWNRILVHAVLIFVMMSTVFGNVQSVSAQVGSYPLGNNLPETDLDNTTPKIGIWKPDTQTSVDLTYSINLPALQAGQSTRVEVLLGNTGTEALYQLQFKVILPAGLNYVPGSTRFRKTDYFGGAWFGPSIVYEPDPAFSPMQWSPIEIAALSDIQPGEVVWISFEVEPNCLFSGGDLELFTEAEEFSGQVYTFTDSATTTYSAPDLDISVTSNKSSTNPIGVFDTVTWNIQVTNESGYDLDVVWVEADLGLAFTYTSSTGDMFYGGDNGINSGQTVTWELRNLPAGATANMTLRAESDSSPCSTDLDMDVYANWGIGTVDGDSTTQPGVDPPDTGACLNSTAIHDGFTGTREPYMAFISPIFSPSTISGFGGESTILVGVENNGSTDAYYSDLEITLPSGLTYVAATSMSSLGVDSSAGLSVIGDPSISGDKLTYYDSIDTGANLFSLVQAAGGNDTGLVSLAVNACGASPTSEIGFQYNYYSVCTDTQYTMSTTSTLAVQTPELQVSHDLPNFLLPDSSARVQITITNTGTASPGSNNHLTIVENLPAGLSYDYTQTMWRVAGGAWHDSEFYSPHISGNQLTWFETDLSLSPELLAPNTSLELSFVVTSDSSFAGGDFENSTTLEIDCSGGSETIDAQNTDTLTHIAPGPIVSTDAASSITYDGAILKGTVNALGYSTDITFEYGLTDTYGTTVTADQSPLDTSTDTPVTYTLTNLSPNTEYHYRVVGVNPYETTNGLDQTFTTAPLPPGPTVVTDAASSITNDGAILNGTVNTLGYSADITFEYGLTDTYGTTVTADQSPLDTSSDTPVTYTLTNLSSNTEYHYHVVGENSFDTTNGLDQTFTTLGAAVMTEIHSGSIHSAITSASINDSLHAMATVVGNGPQVTGDVKFTVFHNPSCYGTGIDAGSITLDASGVADPSTSAILTNDGMSFLAQYQGDSNYLPADGSCTSISTSAYPGILPLSVRAVPQDSEVLSNSLSTLVVQFNQDVLHGAPADADAADNPLNYLLVEAGVNGVFDTIACGGTGGGLQTDDTEVLIDSVIYDEDLFSVKLVINNEEELPDGDYRLFVCGTTSIANPDRTVYLNNHLSDSIIGFIIQNQNTQTSVLPATGFAPDKITILPEQPIEMIYNHTGMEIQIPAIGVRKTIVGVPGPEWDISWLGNDIGYLQGTAFPTWNGNSVLTGHVATVNGKAGPFADLGKLSWGDRLIINAWGQEYFYEVRSVDLWISPDATGIITQHEEFSWLTLVTCHGYDETDDTYRWRTIVRAVLVEVKQID